MTTGGGSDIAATGGRNGERLEGLVCFSINEWADVKRSQVHLMEAAARRGLRVLYIESIGMRRPQVSKRDSLRILRRIARWMRGPTEVAPRFYVASPLVWPMHGTPFAEWLNALLLAGQVRLWRRRCRIPRPAVLTYLPHTLGAVTRLGWHPVLYFIADEYTAYPLVDASKVAEWEKRMIGYADVVGVTSKKFIETREIDAGRCVQIPNAVDIDHFKPTGARLEVAVEERLAKPVLLFTGTLEDWVDEDLLSYVAKSFPQGRVVLAGPMRKDLRDVLQLPNVDYIGVLDYADMPRALEEADVCIIPYRLYEFSTALMNPGKLYQYFAMGKPVVSTRVLEPGSRDSFVYFADSPEDFVKQIETAITQDCPRLAAGRRAHVDSETWEARLDTLLERMESTPCRATFK